MQASWLYRSNTKEFIHNWCSDAVYFTNKEHPIFQHLYLYIPPKVYFLNDSRFHRCYPITIPQRGRCQVGTLNEFDPEMKSWWGSHSVCVVTRHLLVMRCQGCYHVSCHQTRGGICDPGDDNWDIIQTFNSDPWSIPNMFNIMCLRLWCCSFKVCSTAMFSDYQRGGGTICALFMSQ